jgi:hypothetical protein
MTAEEQAVVLVNEVRAEREQELWKGVGDRRGYGIVLEALCRAIERHEDLRQPKALTVTVVSAADGNPMHTFKIDPTKKTIVRPLHSMLGYVFEPEGSHADD